MRNILLMLCLAVITNAACKKEKTIVTPELTISGVQVYEGNSGSVKASVTLSLTKAAESEVSCTVSTVDGTAKAGEDYTAVSGLAVTIAPGELSKQVDILIIPDEDMELNKKFSVKVENVVNAKIQNTTAFINIKNDDTYSPTSDADGVITPQTYPGMTLVWSDEFNDAHLNTDFWTHEKGAHGWGNNELQNYTDSENNVFLENGFLNIKAIQENNGGYTSGRIITLGKKEFTYGRIDIRAKLPKGQGIWPALWMLGGNINSVSWPACGEIDIMEYLGHETNKVYGTAHYDEGGHKYQGSSYSLTTGDFTQKFHVFSIEWQENSIVWYVDYVKYYEFTKPVEAFSKNNFFIMNLAVGGNWPGKPDNSTVFPQTMVVDYVRVFK